MTTEPCSHTICQKSAVVFVMAPWAHISLETGNGGYFQVDR